VAAPAAPATPARGLDLADIVIAVTDRLDPGHWTTEQV